MIIPRDVASSLYTLCCCLLHLSAACRLPCDKVEEKDVQYNELYAEHEELMLCLGQETTKSQVSDVDAAVGCWDGGSRIGQGRWAVSCVLPMIRDSFVSADRCMRQACVHVDSRGGPAISSFKNPLVLGYARWVIHPKSSEGRTLATHSIVR